MVGGLYSQAHLTKQTIQGYNNEILHKCTVWPVELPHKFNRKGVHKLVGNFPQIKSSRGGLNFQDCLLTKHDCNILLKEQDLYNTVQFMGSKATE